MRPQPAFATPFDTTGLNVHLRTASIAAETAIGCPDLARAQATLPLGSNRISMTTIPAKLETLIETGWFEWLDVAYVVAHFLGAKADHIIRSPGALAVAARNRRHLRCNQPCQDRDQRDFVNHRLTFDSLVLASDS